ncbi:MAG: Stress responsive alpha-beta barrel protein [Daejeonella sp.]|nr:Stress responsive alpha-beta barrel protein [Daejeonella sp.]
MNRRKFVKKGSTIAAFAGLASMVPMSIHAQPSPSKTFLHHYVLFWLKPDLSEEKIKEFTGFFEELRKIKGIKSLSYGRAAATASRDVVDNSFSYALSITFPGLDEQSLYQKDPIHLKAIEKFSSFWDKVVVHDSMMA